MFQPLVMARHSERAFLSAAGVSGAAEAAADAKRSKVASKAECLDTVRSPEREL
jgi:hypothetical protein